MLHCALCKDELDIPGRLICQTCKSERASMFLKAQIGLMLRLETDGDERATGRLVEYIKESQECNTLTP